MLFLILWVFSSLGFSMSNSMAHSRNSSSGDGKQVLSLPFGYRFYPTNYEVIRYLKHKILERELPADIIPTIDVYSHSPDQLPLDKFKYGVAGEWFFFTTRLPGDLSTRDGYGYWSPTGLPAEIDLDQRIIGFKQVVDFYWGQSPNGIKSNWTIDEYRLNPDHIDGQVDETTQAKVQNLVACRVRNNDKFHASGGAIEERGGSLPTNELGFLSFAVTDDANWHGNHTCQLK